MREDQSLDAKASLCIVAGPSTSASWRSIIRLGPGRYRFEGLACVERALSLPFGKNQGAALRVAGRDKASWRLLGSSGWESLQTEFAVKDPAELIELLCEFRASGGAARFAKDSLRVIAIE
jgi:hypothetical protein